ncbi:viroplasmin family protein [Desulfosporosinus youngiae]|uniref:ribonuclease H n=1 Tax=Desulfosporosinus youngiae DSM 17734 TaxID=768710 RepID=H5XVI7_9FIRM|nr:ribonuclease H family protein [Desulfosporosinus youngiae]EHQ90070.1 putative double-stranded RNA/RNA-DNA hybrid binding protein [Desulfosporosinus youngiae DSM 17734]
MAKKNFYIVKKGHKTGIFDNWAECQASVKGYKGAVFKGFETKAEALEWLNGSEDTTPRQDSGNEDRAKTARDVDFDVYTDGSYAKGKYSYGYAFVKDGRIVHENNGVGEDLEAAGMRNVAGEIAAVCHAVEKAKSLNVRIRIYHDYSGISHWVTGDWQAKNKFTQAYVAFMRAHHGLYEFQKVAGHSGDRFNDYVDLLAKQALGISRTK